MSSLPVSIPSGAERRAVPRWSRGAVTVLAGVLLLGGGGVLSLVNGSVSLSWSEVGAALTADRGDIASNIVWNLRLPRTLLAAVVGASLAVAGVLLQGVMRNPLAAPDIIGVTAGAALAATVVLVATNGLPSYLPLCAFIGALLATGLVYGIAWQPGQGTSPMRLILAGVAIGLMLGAVTNFLMVTFSDRVQSVLLWMSGSLQDASWHQLILIWPYVLVGLLVAVTLVRPLDALQLGEETAASLGVRIERSRLIAATCAALLAGAAICVTGLIGFVGLMVPHLMRLLIGHRHALLLPAAALGGAVLMVWADLVARTAVAPTELPVGILTALLGGPYFVFLLYRRKLV
jgi:iron complex transport system permease protein